MSGSGRRGRKRFIDYPRYGRTGFWRWLPSFRLVSGLIFSTVIVLVVAFLLAYAATPYKPVDTAALKQTSLVFFSDGTQIGQFKQEQRTNVELATVPLYVRNAVLSAEDRSFYTNNGVSPTGILRALWNNVHGGALQGGSTITQQYVKNFFTGGDRTVTRKAKEFLISLKVAQQVPKDDILRDYLNKIYFGRNAYGIQAAAVAYFGKNVQDLTVSQGAYLAGIIDGPELYDYPPGETDSPPALAAKARWHYVLDGMVTEGSLKADDERAILGKGLPPVIARATVDRSDQRGYLMDMIRTQFHKLLPDRDDLDTGGYIIRTTFRKDLIAKDIASVQDVLGPRKNWPAGTQVGIATVDPTTGKLLSIYGGDDTTAYNAATQAQPVAGSTFKPFTLIPTLRGDQAKGIKPLSLRSRFNGHSPYVLRKAGNYKVPNFGDPPEQPGTVDLIKATAESVNTVYAQLNERIGSDDTYATAIAAGLPATTEGLNKTALNVLGPSAPHVVDMASAYGTIAAQGVRNPMYMIESITSDHDKTSDYKHEAAPVQVFPESVMADTSYALQQVIKQGTGTYARALGRPAAGKTGTSTGNVSAWFVGFTPQLSTAVAMYRSKPGGGQDVLKGWGPFKGRELAGATFPVRVWTSVMKAALDGVPVKDFPEPVFDGDVLNPAPSPTPTPTPSAVIDTPSPSDTGPPTGQPSASSPQESASPGGQPTDPSSPQPTVVQPSGPGTPTAAGQSG